MWATAPLLAHAVAACFLAVLALAVDGVPTGGNQPLTSSVADVIKNHTNLTTFAAALASAESSPGVSRDLLSFLGEPVSFGVFGYTVLAPSDAAFLALPEGIHLEDLEAILRYEFLSHHINLRTTTLSARLPVLRCRATTSPPLPARLSPFYATPARAPEVGTRARL